MKRKGKKETRKEKENRMNIKRINEKGWERRSTKNP